MRLDGFDRFYLALRLVSEISAGARAHTHEPKYTHPGINAHTHLGVAAPHRKVHYVIIPNVA